MPKPTLLVLGAILEGDSRRAVRLVRWIAGHWQYEPSGTEVGRYGHRVTHWMPLPEPPGSDE
jgi:hypothetical protein